MKCLLKSNINDNYYKANVKIAPFCLHATMVYRKYMLCSNSVYHSQFSLLLLTIKAYCLEYLSFRIDLTLVMMQERLAFISFTISVIATIKCSNFVQ